MITKSNKINLDNCLKDTQCWFDQFIEGGLDNTGTSFRHTNQVYIVTLNDGTQVTFNIASATGWSDQVSQISAGLLSVMPWLVESTSYCTIGCGGLPEPFIELPDMLWRYSGFKICPGEKFPVKVEYTSDQVTSPRVLVLNTILSDKIYLDRCYDCGKEEEFYLRGTDEVFTPFCPKPCGEPEYVLPQAVCSFTFRDGCDQNNIVNGQPQAITLQYIDCGEGELLSSIYSLDSDGGLEEYSPILIDGVANIDDCNGGIIVPPEPVVVCVDLEETLICIDGVTGVKKTCTNSDGSLIITYETELGEVKVDDFTYGKCKCPCTQYAGCIDLRGKTVDSVLDSNGNILPLNFPLSINDFLTEFNNVYPQSESAYINFGANLCDNANRHELQIVDLGFTLSSITYSGTGIIGTLTHDFYSIGDCPQSVSAQAQLLEGCVNGIESVAGIDALTGQLLWGPKPLSDYGFTDCCEETEDIEILGDQTICTGPKLGATIFSSATGNAVHQGDVYGPPGNLTDWDGYFVIVDSAGTSHTIQRDTTITGLASGQTQSVTFIGWIEWNDGNEGFYRCPIDKLISANFTVN